MWCDNMPRDQSQSVLNVFFQDYNSAISMQSEILIWYLIYVIYWVSMSNWIYIE